MKCTADNQYLCGGYLTNAIYRINGTFSSWAEDNNQPNNLNSYQWCAAMDISKERQYDDQNCNMEFIYICQLAATYCTGKDPRYFMLFNKCLYLDPNVKDTWYRGRNTCLRQQGTMYVMSSNDERKQILDYLVSKGIQERFIFLGLAKNMFYWMDETGGTEMTSNFFGDKQPQPTDGKSQLKCVYINPKINYNWFTASCATNFSYICQYKKPPMVPTSATIRPTTRRIVTQSPVVVTTRYASPGTGTPDFVPVSSNNLALPIWAIALLALLGLLLLLLLLFCCIWCFCCRNKRDSKKVQVLDVRPKAPIPQTGPVGKTWDDMNDKNSVSGSTDHILNPNHKY